MLTFPMVTNRTERLYVHSIWRYMLGWGIRPPLNPSTLKQQRRKELRQLAVSEIQRPKNPTGKVLQFPSRKV